MTQHYTKNTEQVSAYCPTCNGVTMHLVSDGRRGRCVNEHHKDKLTKNLKHDQGSLFEVKP
jgi:ribosomal protein L44E